jgi:hypothetical protein
MSNKLRLITVREAAEILGLAEKTIHNRGGGTALLNRIYQGASVRLVEHEVINHRDKMINASRNRLNRRSGALRQAA